MSFFVPERVRKTAVSFGTEGERWLEQLPTRVAELEQEWSVAAGPPYEADGCVSWVAPARGVDGAQAVLKISIPHREARHEAEALRAWDGQGAVRLLRASEDGFCMLIERCIPGTNLWSLGEEEANEVGAAILQRVWREPPPGASFETVAAIAAEWCEEMPREAPTAGHDPELVEQAVRLARELSATQPRQVIVHGDFHPGNVLAAERESWLAIDCKPLVGDPAYDLAQWFGNRVEAAVAAPDPVAAIRRQIDQFSRLLDLDPARIAGWAFVKSIGWEWGPDAARLLHAALTG